MMLASRAGGYMDNSIISVDGGRNMVRLAVISSATLSLPRRLGRVHWSELIPMLSQNAGISDGIRMPEESYA